MPTYNGYMTNSSVCKATGIKECNWCSESECEHNTTPTCGDCLEFELCNNVEEYEPCCEEFQMNWGI